MPYSSMILPLDHLEPLAATLGIMLYPDEPQKAEAYAKWFLSRAIQKEIADGHKVAYETMRKFACAAPPCMHDVDLRLRMGFAVGTLLKVAFAIWGTDERLVSWRNAQKIVANETGNSCWKAGIKSLEAWRLKLMAVAHLWCAFALRGGRIVPPGVTDFDGDLEFRYFLAEAECLRAWGQSFVAPRKKAVPLLPERMWRTPVDWETPQPNFEGPGPVRGVIQATELLPEQAALLNLPGRPSKKVR